MCSSSYLLNAHTKSKYSNILFENVRICSHVKILIKSTKFKSFAFGLGGHSFRAVLEKTL